MEFWADDILSSILSVAGEFLYSDEATRARNRGGFARACVRVDLGLPLRPGVRIRGADVPFWQQFSFENVDGICDRCASLHLKGPCKQEGVRLSSPAPPLFGPWMAAVRRRRPDPVLHQSQAVGDRMPPGSASVSKDGWSVPKKIARRRLPPASVLLQPSCQEGGRDGASAVVPEAAINQVEEGLNQAEELSLAPSQALSAVDLRRESSKHLSVPVDTVAEYQALAEGMPCSEHLKPETKSELDKASCFPKVALESCITKDSASGPSKRARPVEPASTRMPTRSSKIKGKGIASGIGRAGDKAAFTFAASSGGGGRGVSAQPGPGAKKARGRVGLLSGLAPDLTLPIPLDTSNHESAVQQLKQAIQLPVPDAVMDPVQTAECPDMGPRVCFEMIPGATAALMVSDQANHGQGPGDLNSSVEMSEVLVGALPNPASQ